MKFYYCCPFEGVQLLCVDEAFAMQILWNGATTTEFKPSRGVRQVLQILYLFFFALLREISAFDQWGGESR